MATTPLESVIDVCCPSVLEAPLTEDQAGEVARMFAALADPVRLRLLSLVAAADEVCSCDLQAPLGKSQPTISHHTKALAEAGLIVGERRGNGCGGESYQSVSPPYKPHLGRPNGVEREFYR